MKIRCKRKVMCLTVWKYDVFEEHIFTPVLLPGFCKVDELILLKKLFQFNTAGWADFAGGR